MKLAKIEHPKLSKGKDYDAELLELQHEVLKIQRAFYRQDRRALIVFEGWDAAGKGGTIRRITEKMDPRGVRVHPIAAPSPEDQGRHYLYRFWTKLPAPGQVAIFDRSWYGRVLVERVEGFAAAPEWQRAYDEINEFERMLVDDGARIVKIFLHITPKEQLRRFKERFENPLKCWKLTPDDFRNRDKWPLYEEAIEDMVKNTSTKEAPWTVVGADHKKAARLEVLKSLVQQLSDGVDIAPPRLAAGVAEVAAEAFKDL